MPYKCIVPGCKTRWNDSKVFLAPYTNKSCSNKRAELLRNNSNQPEISYYKVDNNVISHIYDVPHLLKCFRNNFQKKYVLVGGQRAQWKHLEMLYKDDGSGGQARTTKLTDKHINPQAYDKMKVNNIKSLNIRL